MGDAQQNEPPRDRTQPPGPPKAEAANDVVLSSARPSRHQTIPSPAPPYWAYLMSAESSCRPNRPTRSGTRDVPPSNAIEPCRIPPSSRSAIHRLSEGRVNNYPPEQGKTLRRTAPKNRIRAANIEKPSRPEPHQACSLTSWQRGAARLREYIPIGRPRKRGTFDGFGSRARRPAGQGRFTHRAHGS